MPAIPSEKSRKHTMKPYSRKPGPNRNQPASALKKIKQPSKQLTSHDWLTVFTWIDTNPYRSQQDVVDYFANRREGPLHFDQATLSRKSKNRGDIVKVNPAALSARRQRVIVAPEIERALVLRVDGMLAGTDVVSGPVLTAGREVLEDKFDVPPRGTVVRQGLVTASL